MSTAGKRRTNQNSGWGFTPQVQRMVAAGMLAVAVLPFRATGVESPSADARHTYQIKSWQAEDGLPENSATAMVQTPDGYLWFGTFNGLVRFDGLKFTVFDRANTPELPGAEVVNLHLDRAGRLWVSTLNGLVVRDGTNWSVVREAPTTDRDYVRCFVERTNGDLLLTLSKGGILESIAGRIRKLPTPPGEAGTGFLGFTDEEGHWWVAQRGFTGTWDGSRWQASPPHQSDPSLKDLPWGAGQARDGGFWLTVNGELRKYSRGQLTAVVSLSDDHPGGVGSISKISEDSSGNLWIASYDAGLAQVLPNGTIRHWHEEDGIGYKDVRFVFEDREQNLWVGTSGGGLQLLKTRRFQAFGYTQGGEARVVGSISGARDGSVWVSTFGQGLFRWDPHVGFARVKPPGSVSQYLHFTSVLNDRQERTWLGAIGGGLLVFGADGVRSIDAAEYGGDGVTDLFEDSRGRIWISNGTQVSVSDDAGIRILDEQSGLRPGDVSALGEDRDGMPWVATLNEVYRFSGQRFEPVRDSAGAHLRDVVCLKSDDHQTMWLGTADRGLLRWRAGSVVALQSRSGLPVRGVLGILEDRHGYFWLASREGIVRVHRSSLESVADGRLATLSCQRFDTSDGLPSNDCAGQHQPVCAADAEGRLWFSTAKGPVRVDPEHIQINAAPPIVHIESIQYVPAVGYRGQREEPVRLIAPFPEKVILPPGSSEIEFEYTALSFAAPEKVVFQVKTEGQNPGWVPRGDSRMERLHALPPRDYVFRVRAANNDGVWNTTGASLVFSVLPYYWQTTWFGVGVSTLLISSGGALAWSWSRKKVRLAEERHRSELETRQLREELAHFGRVSTMGQLASALAHELSQPLSAILRNAEAAELLVKQDPADLAEISAIITDIRKDDQRAAAVISRMRSLLKKRPLELTDLTPRELVDDVVTLTRADALQRKVQVTSDIPSELPAIRGDRIQLQQVLLNLFLNGMDAMSEQPAESRRLTVRVQQAEPGAIRFAVCDHGPGIPGARLSRLFEPFFSTKPQGLGLGLTISRSIVEAHGGRLWAEDDPKGGAQLVFTMPVAREGSAS